MSQNLSLLLLALLAVISYTYAISDFELEQLIDNTIGEVLAEDAGDDDMATTCRVTASALNFRSSASTYSSVLKVLPSGKTCTKVSEYNGWTRMNCDGRYGYVSSSYVSCSSSGGSTGGSSYGGSSSSSSQSCSVTASALNFRSSASTYSSVIKVLPRGKTCSKVSESSGWTKMTCDGRTGYVSSSYVSCGSGSSTGGSTGGSSYTGGSSSSGCSLMTYRSDVLTGKSVVINTGFKSNMDKIVSYARQCGVKLYITSSFRTNTNVAGAIVTPASRSNHMVGRAIDYNIQSSDGWCNSSCMRGWLSGRISSKPKCFLDKVDRDSSLRTGLRFNTVDAVHIDDGKNVKDPRGWDREYQSAQQSHKNRCY